MGRDCQVAKKPRRRRSFIRLSGSFTETRERCWQGKKAGKTALVFGRPFGNGAEYLECRKFSKKGYPLGGGGAEEVWGVRKGKRTAHPLNLRGPKGSFST